MKDSEKDMRTVFVCGLHSCAHALREPDVEWLNVWFANGLRSSALLRLRDEVHNRGLPCRSVPRRELDRISGFANHQGVLMERSLPAPGAQVDIATLAIRGQQEPLLVLALDHLQDPHNLGACLRSAEAAAVDAVLVSRRRSAGLSSAAAKAACGAMEHVPVLLETDITASLARLCKAGFWIAGMADEAEKSIWECSFSFPQVVVFGSEGRGLRRAVRTRCDELLHIPMMGQVENLNVSVACGITLYEIRRQQAFNGRDGERG